MRYTSLIVFITGLVLNLSAQDLPPILTSPVRKGIYLSYLEFVNNSPSVTEGFDIEMKNDHVYLKTEDKQIKKLVKDFWGACDGNAVYVSSFYASALRYTVGKNELSRIQSLDRYCYFELQAFSETVASGVAIQTTQIVPYVINLNRGLPATLTKDILATILKSDSDLAREYENARRPGNRLIMRDFILKYNARHRDEINYTKMTTGVIFYPDRSVKSSLAIEVTMGDETPFVMTDTSIVERKAMQPRFKVCAGDHCDEILVRNDLITYVMLTQTSDGPRFKYVDYEQGQFETKVLDFRRKRRNEKEADGD